MNSNLVYFSDTEGWSDDFPLHTNSISAFYMDKTEVTSNLWAEVYTWAVANGYSKTSEESHYMVGLHFGIHL